MKAAHERINDELMVFADLGTDGAQSEQTHEGFTFRLCRNGEELALVFAADGKVIERCRGSKPQIHASYRALLASRRFGDLRSWAATQKMLLLEMEEIKPLIPVQGTLADGDDQLTASNLDDFLQSTERSENSVQIMLIDGPAGIGKTKFIEVLALARATAYGRRHHPLVLHVQSRGRVLSYLQDLIAFSLQRLRLSVTFDQLPVLVRHGLVTLAIDGFDELGDPNGYDLAWSQVNETIDEIRGGGTLILAGRETFTGLKRLKSNLRVLPQDIVHGLALHPPSPKEAEHWLRREKIKDNNKKKGWSKDDVENIRYLLDPGSYALRPFFLARLAETDFAKPLHKATGTSLLSILIDLMVDRESQKLGDAVDRVWDAGQRRQYAHRFLCEAARYMADDQTDIIGEIPLTWLVDMALPRAAEDADTVRMLKNRAGVMAFLANDALPGYRRFAHSQVFNYFLSVAAIESVGKGEIPKFVRRNILSADFLAVFVEVLHHIAKDDPNCVTRFFNGAQEWVRNYQSIDRGARNLGAWLIAALPTLADISREDEVGQIGPLEVDETIIKGTMPRVVLRGVTVNQIDIRGADLRALKFEECSLATAIVDGGTRVSETFPTPTHIRQDNIGKWTDERDPAGFGTWTDERDPAAIGAWLDAHGRSRVTEEAAPDPESGHGRMLRLVERACRSRTFWIPENTDTTIDRFIKDPLWPAVLKALKEHDFIREQQRAAKGTQSRFFHIRQSDRILANDRLDDDVARFYAALAEAAP